MPRVGRPRRRLQPDEEQDLVAGVDGRMHRLGEHRRGPGRRRRRVLGRRDRRVADERRDDHPGRSLPPRALSPSDGRPRVKQAALAHQGRRRGAAAGGNPPTAFLPVDEKRCSMRVKRAGSTEYQFRPCATSSAPPAFLAALLPLANCTEPGVATQAARDLPEAAAPARRGGRPRRRAARRGSDLACLAEAVYFEARGTGAAGETAVAHVVVNRAKSPQFPRTVCGVVGDGCQFSYRCDGRSDALADSGAARPRLQGRRGRARRRPRLHQGRAVLPLGAGRARLVQDPRRASAPSAATSSTAEDARTRTLAPEFRGHFARYPDRVR